MHDTNNDKEELVSHTKVNVPAEQSIRGELLPSSSSLRNIQDNPAVAYLVSLGSKRSRQTMSSFLNIVAKMIGFQNLRDCAWSSMRRHHILAVLEMLGDAGKAPATINTYLSALKGVALEAWTMKQIDTDSFQHIKQVRSVRGSRLPKGRALERHEIRSLFFTCESDSSAKGLRDAAILGVLLGCGLRRSEIVALDMGSMIYKDRALKVLGKGNKERMAYVPGGAWKRLDKWVEEVRGTHEGPLFPRIRRFDDVTGERMSDQAIYHILETRRVEAGLEMFAPHDLRRTFASSMLDNGEDIVTVKDAMGHSSIATTQKYDRRGDERLKRASQRLDIAD
ncbi:TPA: tyrosine-type recombinase/integrase [Citrobacter freundii]|uniref:tyrosine-type recombinase/integrase n=1 Tax=Enterobacteriaceae TaxID=543 RepID=UPI000C9A59A3|nr:MULTISPECIES: tyrosine-type recombinase/integrase [Enterobacteriaceae]MBJ8853236.1 tyrosine-type recombinase/integrase [Citrobacter freundii]MDT7028934.1 integrase [Klebsiella variicola]NTX98481.1 tyrosine-type recombinase/integrase [Citrobacter freundii]NTY46888.1 tyrosine-type recombinase/integrase [Citrobacter freundii]NUN59023.1 tyrosine-type recombinase/integrase [Citrobacter freundii]